MKKHKIERMRKRMEERERLAVNRKLKKIRQTQQTANKIAVDSRGFLCLRELLSNK